MSDENTQKYSRFYYPPDKGCPCEWLLAKGLICGEPSTHWSDISNMVYCDEHAARFTGHLQLIELQ